MNAPMPQQQVAKNKIQLIALICEELQKLDDVPFSTSHYRGISPKGVLPMEVRSDALVQIFDLKTTNEETDVVTSLEVIFCIGILRSFSFVVDSYICVAFIFAGSVD